MAKTKTAKRRHVGNIPKEQSQRDRVLEQQREDKAKLARALRNEREIASSMSKLARLMQSNTRRRAVLGAELLESVGAAVRETLGDPAANAVEAASE